MRLFISYSHDDKAWVYELWRALRDRGHHDAWIDQRIIPAQDWWDSILTHIEQAECVIYVMTPKSVESIYCLAETKYALALNKPVLPLMLKPCDCPAALRRIQYEMIDDGMGLGDILFTVERGVGEIRVNLVQGRYAPSDPQPPRPDEPKPARNPEQVSEVFMLAEEAASENNTSLAEKLFQRVMDADPDGYGVAAAERLGEIRYERGRSADYLNIVQMMANPALRKGAAALWRVFVRKYGTEYDPQGMAALFESRPVPTRSAPAPARSRTVELLPLPFEWIEIPAGKVKLVSDEIDQKESYLKRDTVFDVPAFAIAKYPLTNAQYAKFIEAGGYREKRWWTAAGWQQREKDGWTEPRWWQDQTWNGAEQPVVGVSWYEAAAFCRWLSEISGENVILPTEQQWQRAAQGNDGRAYPWGNEWGGTRCNNWVPPQDSRQTTPVRQYEGRGDSPFGVVDMAGNMWEWCLTAYESGSTSLDGTDVRVLRGGSWGHSYSEFFRAAYRFRIVPFVGSGYHGFRCARSYR